MINQNRLIKDFITMTEFDSESFGEAEFAAYVKARLERLGLQVTEDNAAQYLKKDHPGCVSNIYGYLKGTVPGEARLLCAHLDTVCPGAGKKAVLHNDGTITSDGNTVLGADDVAGVSAIFEALEVIIEDNIEHPDIEVLFTVAEEPYCTGSRYLDYSLIRSRQGYVLDMSGPVGRAAVAAPSILALKVYIHGRAAHAGFEPENGINALSVASRALSQIRTGHIDPHTTVNFGTIHGGSGRNIVPEEIVIEGEIRSMSDRSARAAADGIRRIFKETAEAAGADTEVEIAEQVHAYRVEENDPVTLRFMEAAACTSGLTVDPSLTETFGGSDANNLNLHGIRAIVPACAMCDVHSKNEYTTASELALAAAITFHLMTLR